MKSIDDVIAKPVNSTALRNSGNTSATGIDRAAGLEAQEAQNQGSRAVQPPNIAGDKQTLGSAVESLNTLGENTVPALEFEIDDDRDVVVIKVINRSTGEVIRELPPEAVVDAATRGDGALPALVEASA